MKRPSAAPPLAEIQAALARKSLYQFLLQAWKEIDSAELIDNWHIRVICDRIQAAVMSPTGDNLIVNIPPGSMKSSIASVVLIPWIWLHKPGYSAIYASGNPRVSVRDSIKARAIIRSDWYKRLCPKFQLADDQDTKTLFRNDKGGSRLAIGAGSAVTGSRGDLLVIDDALDAADAMSEIAKENIREWYSTSFQNRVNDMKKACRIVIGQRLAVDDLPGALIETGAYDLLCLPMAYDTTRPDPLDIRKNEGELLFPERFPQSVLDKEKAALGSLAYAGQYQQEPYDAKGGMFKLDWFRFYETGSPGRPRGCNTMPDVKLPDQFQELITSWDCAFKGAKDSDYVCGTLWGRVGSSMYLLKMFHKQTGFAGTIAAIKAMADVRIGPKQQRARKHLIEDKANGSAIIETLKGEITGVIAVNPEGGKESRAAAVSPMFEAGNVFFPEGAPWLESCFAEFVGFPVAKNDDRVDSTTQALLVLYESSVGIGRRFVQAARAGKLGVRVLGIGRFS